MKNTISASTNPLKRPYPRESPEEDLPYGKGFCTSNPSIGPFNRVYSLKYRKRYDFILSPCFGTSSAIVRHIGEDYIS
jgi:hypothetical protein